MTPNPSRDRVLTWGQTTRCGPEINI